MVHQLTEFDIKLKYCIVTVDYFSKWVEAEPLAIITSTNIQKFVWKSIIYRFGCLRIIIVDNSYQFIGASFQAMAEKF